MPFLHEPLVYCRPDGVSFELASPVIYEGKTDRWEIPQGFTTDFATVPAVVSWAIPKLGAYSMAAITHDYFCVALAGGCTFISARDADAVFRRIMREADVDFVTRWLVWTGVRWGALFNPARRPGWHRDAPLVLLISALAAPVVVPASVFALVGRGALRGASWLLRAGHRLLTRRPSTTT